jgi:hypothetical protein
MKSGSLAKAFLALSIVLVAIDFSLPRSITDGPGVLGGLLVWGLLVLSLAFLFLFIAFRGRSY